MAVQEKQGRGTISKGIRMRDPVKDWVPIPSIFSKGRKRAMGSEKQQSMHAIYMGPDEMPFGLVHGKRYEIEVGVLKSGRRRITVLDSAFSPLRLTYATENDFKIAWRKPCN
jgi:hypothetical protein